MKPRLFILTILTVLFAVTACTKEDPVNTKLIVYPAQGNYGLNLLDTVKVVYEHGVVSLCATLNEDASLRVKVSGEKWTLQSGTLNQWNVSSYNDTDGSRIFTSIQTGTIDGKLALYPDQPVVVSVYENRNEWASRTKTISVE